jgi:hypothetical protein
MNVGQPLPIWRFANEGLPLRLGGRGGAESPRGAPQGFRGESNGPRQVDLHVFDGRTERRALGGAAGACKATTQAIAAGFGATGVEFISKRISLKSLRSLSCVNSLTVYHIWQPLYKFHGLLKIE